MDEVQCIQYNPDFWRYYVTALLMAIVYIVLLILIADAIFGPKTYEINEIKFKLGTSMTEIQEWVNERREKSIQNEYNKFVFMETIGILSIIIGMVLGQYDHFLIISGGLSAGGVWIVVRYGLQKLSEYGRFHRFIGTLGVMAFTLFCVKILCDRGFI